MEKLFIRLEDIKTRMGINAELDVDEALESAIIAAQLRIEQYLDSKLDRNTWQTKYLLDGDSYSGVQPGGLFRMYLASGLVDNSVAMVLQYGKAWNAMTDTIPATDYYLDAIRGICYIDNKWANYYVTAAYTTGYEKASKIPSWLRETILAYAPVVLDFSGAATNNKEAEKNYSTSCDHALAIASAYQRNVGMVIRPLF